MHLHLTICTSIAIIQQVVGAVFLAMSRGDNLHATRRVFVNHMLSGVQQRNLERAWGRPVVDRVGLIIDIFAQRARTKEAQLQVSLSFVISIWALASPMSWWCRLK